MFGFYNLEKINRQNSLFTFSKTALINLRDLTKISLRRMVSVWGFHNFPVRQVMWYALILLCEIEEIFSY